VASACVDYCLTEYITPHWHCWADNLPSVAVAEKVGFKKSLVYPAYRIEI
jgi:RimJ/RimL family protein N-acetyltransferase